MNKILTLLAITLLLMACAKKAIPVLKDRNVEPPVLKQPFYPPQATVVANLEKGQALFSTACQKCHETPAPNNFTASAWDGYLYSMLPRTGLNNEEAFHLRAYVIAHAKNK
jgi:cytochrome c5